MCTFSMTIKTFLLCLCLTACNGNEEVTEAETSSGYPSLLNKTVPVPAEYLGETASQGSVVQIDYDTRNYVDGNGEMRSNMGIRNHPMNAMMCSISYMGMEKQLPPSFRTRTA